MSAHLPAELLVARFPNHFIGVRLQDFQQSVQELLAVLLTPLAPPPFVLRQAPQQRGGGDRRGVVVLPKRADEVRVARGNNRFGVPVCVVYEAEGSDVCLIPSATISL